MRSYVYRLGAMEPEERKREIIRTLRSTRGNVAKASRILGVWRTGLWYQIHLLGIADEVPRIRRECRNRFTLSSGDSAA